MGTTAGRKFPGYGTGGLGKDPAVFEDSPTPEEWQELLAGWRRPERLPEPPPVDYLYAYIRLNIKRGRVFDLHQVLRTGEADCLGYAKLFTALARQNGLDAGVVEIIIDNRGRNVPHTASLVKLADGKNKFVDFWYGSTDIRHRRIGLRVKRRGVWCIEDLDYSDIAKAEDISYLPDDRADAITLYIRGNGALKEGRFKKAVEYYSESIRLYPQNARVYYNRAIAFEKQGQAGKAEADYKLALQDAVALKRTLASQPQDVVDLIKLDECLVPELDQQIYLMRRAFVTGRKVPVKQIAAKLAVPEGEVEAVLKMLEKIL